MLLMDEELFLTSTEDYFLSWLSWPGLKLIFHLKSHSLIFAKSLLSSNELTISKLTTEKWRVICKESKASQKLNALIKTRSYMDQKNRRIIMKACIDSQFGCCPLGLMMHQVISYIAGNRSTFSVPFTTNYQIVIYLDFWVKNIVIKFWFCYSLCIVGQWIKNIKYIKWP